jgi:hypothetical protein
MKYLIFLVLAFTITAADAKQKFYKWTDADGNVHYTETKPEDKTAEEIKVSTAQPKVTASKPEKKEEIKIDTEGKSPEQIEIEKFNAESQAKVKEMQDKANCKIAKQNLATLQKTVRVRRIDPETGESIRMGDEERMQVIANAKKAIKDLCK